MKLFEVGGCVRDELLGLHTKDIDFTVELDDLTLSVDEGWERMLDFLKQEDFKIFLETKDCFTVRARFPKNHQHEGLIADFVMARKEIGYIENTRQPILELGSFEDDMVRRDFTVNALCKTEEGQLVDLFGGLKDLEDRILRTPLDPMVTLMDDPLRLLRALRFSVTKDFKICEELSNAMKQLDLLDKLQKVVSQERIREEVTKMMKHDTVRSLRIIDTVPGLMEVIFKNGIWLMPTMKQ